MPSAVFVRDIPTRGREAGHNIRRNSNQHLVRQKPWRGQPECPLVVFALCLKSSHRKVLPMPVELWQVLADSVRWRRFSQKMLGQRQLIY